MIPSVPHPGTTAMAVALASVAALAGCNRQGPAAQQAAGRPATPVGTVVLAAHPIEQTSEFIATIRSQQSTTIQPEVDGLVTRILVRPGDRVRAGTPLVQINAEKQRATVRSTEATRAGVEADAQYWRQQVKRLESLVEAGAISRQEFEQAQNSLRTAEARLDTLDAQVREGRVELQYYTVNAPQSGIVGEIPIRLGDRVTQSTAITTIDGTEGLEVYIQVPLERSPELRLGLPVQILDTQGKVVATNPVTFVASRVDDATQAVLVKSRLREMPAGVRVQQFVRSRIVWRSAEGLTVPVTAVTRVSGQHFCYIAEPGQQGGFVARQTPVQLGEVVGNDYVVRGGLKAGDRLIVAGIQKIGDGAPVKPE